MIKFPLNEKNEDLTDDSSSYTLIKMNYYDLFILILRYK